MYSVLICSIFAVGSIRISQGVPANESLLSSTFVKISEQKPHGQSNAFADPDSHRMLDFVVRPFFHLRGGYGPIKFDESDVVPFEKATEYCVDLHQAEVIRAALFLRTDSMAIPKEGCTKWQNIKETFTQQMWGPKSNAATKKMWHLMLLALNATTYESIAPRLSVIRPYNLTMTDYVPINEADEYCLTVQAAEKYRNIRSRDTSSLYIPKVACAIWNGFKTPQIPHLSVVQPIPISPYYAPTQQMAPPYQPYPQLTVAGPILQPILPPVLGPVGTLHQHFHQLEISHHGRDGCCDNATWGTNATLGMMRGNGNGTAYGMGGNHTADMKKGDDWSISLYEGHWLGDANNTIGTNGTIHSDAKEVVVP